MEKVKSLYRYEMAHYNDRTELIKTVYNVERATPSGYWIKKTKWGKERWINSTARNRFAWETESGALKGFIRRKTYRNHCIKSEMERNNETLILAKQKLKDDKQGKK